MLRAVRRSGLPAWYTEGFHPHLYLMFPLALSLGAESCCEVMDLRLTEELLPDEVLGRLNAALPEGLEALQVQTPVHTAVEIGSARYRIRLHTENAAALLTYWAQFLAQPEISVEKRTKKGMKTMDIKSMINVQVASAEGNNLLLTLLLPAGNEGNINVSVVTDAFQKYTDMPFCVEQVLREKIFCLNGEEFF
jgi:radical SAM-linked protein